MRASVDPVLFPLPGFAGEGRGGVAAACDYPTLTLPGEAGEGTERTLPVTAHAPEEPRRARAHVRQLDLPDRVDALFRHAVRRLVGRDPVALRDLEDLREVVVDRAHHAHRALAVVAVDLERHVHEATGVDRVVRRVQDAALLDLVADLVVRELVVRGAADDLA